MLAEDEFCFLAPRVGDPLADHKLLGPTYAQALSWEGRRFQATYQSMLTRSTRSTTQLFVMVFSLLVQSARLLIKAIVLKFLLWIEHVNALRKSCEDHGREILKRVAFLLIIWYGQLCEILATKRQGEPSAFASTQQKDMAVTMHTEAKPPLAANS